jgi:hypothetical protein
MPSRPKKKTNWSTARSLHSGANVSQYEEAIMPKSRIIVDAVQGISPAGEERPAPPRIAVKLHGGETVHLDMSTPRAKAWAGILGTMQRAKQAVYLETDPRTNIITELLIPRAVKVATLKSGNRRRDVEVELVVSQMRHYLRRSNPNFNGLLSIFENALKTETPVLVTDSRDRNEIIDVRLIPETVSVPGYLSAPLTQLKPPTASPSAPKKTRPRSGKGGAQ